MPDYPRIPDPPACPLAVTVEQYGLALFAFVLEIGTDASLSDEQAQTALYAGTRLVAVPRDTYAPAAYARMVDTHRMLAATVRRRTAPSVAPEAMGAPQRGRLTPSSPVPLVPLPKSNPPAGGTAELDPITIDRSYDRIAF